MNHLQKEKKPLKYKYHRICQLEECDIEFDTNRKKHFFCCPAHQQEYWKRIRSGDRAIISEVSRQRNDIEKIKEKLGISNG